MWDNIFLCVPNLSCFLKRYYPFWWLFFLKLGTQNSMRMFAGSASIMKTTGPILPVLPCWAVRTGNKTKQPCMSGNIGPVALAKRMYSLLLTIQNKSNVVTFICHQRYYHLVKYDWLCGIMISWNHCELCMISNCLDMLKKEKFQGKNKIVLNQHQTEKQLQITADSRKRYCQHGWWPFGSHFTLPENLHLPKHNLRVDFQSSHN